MTEDNPVLYYYFQIEAPTEESDLLTEVLEIGLDDMGFTEGDISNRSGLSYRGVTVSILDSHRKVEEGYSAKNIKVIFRREPTTIIDFDEMYSRAKEVIDLINESFFEFEVGEERYVTSKDTLIERLG